MSGSNDNRFKHGGDLYVSPSGDYSRKPLMPTLLPAIMGLSVSATVFLAISAVLASFNPVIVIFTLIAFMCLLGTGIVHNVASGRHNGDYAIGLIAVLSIGFILTTIGAVACILHL